jgi:hypothetical protein
MTVAGCDDPTPTPVAVLPGNECDLTTAAQETECRTARQTTRAKIKPPKTCETVRASVNGCRGCCRGGTAKSAAL